MLRERKGLVARITDGVSWRLRRPHRLPGGSFRVAGCHRCLQISILFYGTSFAPFSQWQQGADNRLGHESQSKPERHPWTLNMKCVVFVFFLVCGVEMNSRQVFLIFFLLYRLK